MAVPLSTHLHWWRVALRYYTRAQTRYAVHSPFLSRWVEAVLEDNRDFYAFDDIEDIREYWQRSPQKITLAQDFGAGSRAGQGAERAVSDLARYSAVPGRVGERLFRLAMFTQPRTILELGTNLGFSAMYLQAAARNAQLWTLEGQDSIARLAAHSFQRLRLPTPNIVIGPFAERLPEVLTQLPSIDLVWLDGDHRGVATLAYFEQLQPHLHEHSVVAVGDIHWSPDMESAWEQLKAHPSVTMSVDVLDFGVLFFRKEQRAIEHFILIPQRWKPWRLGFF